MFIRLLNIHILSLFLSLWVAFLSLISFLSLTFFSFLFLFYLFSPLFSIPQCLPISHTREWVMHLWILSAWFTIRSFSPFVCPSVCPSICLFKVSFSPQSAWFSINPSLVSVCSKGFLKNKNKSQKVAKQKERKNVFKKKNTNVKLLEIQIQFKLFNGKDASSKKILSWSIINFIVSKKKIVLSSHVSSTWFNKDQ